MRAPERVASGEGKIRGQGFGKGWGRNCIVSIAVAICCRPSSLECPRSPFTTVAPPSPSPPSPRQRRHCNASTLVAPPLRRPLLFAGFRRVLRLFDHPRIDPSSNSEHPCASSPLLSPFSLSFSLFVSDSTLQASTISFSLTYTTDPRLVHLAKELNRNNKQTKGNAEKHRLTH